MGRTVIKVDTTPVWYAPDIDDNRKDPKPFRVLISPLTAGEMSRARHAMYADVMRSYSDDEKIPREAYDTGAKDMVEMLLGEHILEVANYTQKDSTTGELVNVTTGVGLVEAELTTEIHAANDEIPVLDDIWEALEKTSKLNEGVLGNSDGRPASSEPPTNGARTPANATAPASEASGSVATPIPRKIPIRLASSETSEDARQT